MRKALKMSLLLGTIVVLLALTACGVDGDYKSNSAPEIRITSWEGVETGTDVSEIDSLVFQQRIYWNANDKDGVIAGVAYRILDENGTPIATPGNAVIDEIGDIESVNYQGSDLTGWVVHYKTGADENIPLDSPDAKRTIWSKKQYATINFPANEDGHATERISSFEVICIDNRGAVSNIAKKSFKAKSSLPGCILSTSRGNPGGKQVGTGLYLTFSMSTPVGDPFSVPGADYFEYKVEKINKADSTVISATEWFNTKLEAKVNEVKLTKFTNPALSPDFAEDGVTQETVTRVTAHVYNLAGVRSGESIIEFAVKEGFHPRTMIYPEKVYALGNHHYRDYVDPNDLEVYPFILMSEGSDRYATRFFRDTEGRKTAINSSNLKVYATWGYWGQFGTPPTSSSGATIFSESPYDTEVGHVLNDADSKDYYSEIIAYDIRFDGAPYDFYALSQDPDNMVTHRDGTEWLRVPKNSVWSISKGLEVNNLSSGMHKLEVSAVDLQDEYDPDHAVLEFYLVDFIPDAERTGVMVIEASNFPTPNANNYTQTYVDSIYQATLSGFAGVDFFNRKEINQVLGVSKDGCNLAYSDLQRYKTVIYREEIAGTSYFTSDYDAFKLYVNDGGDILLSAAQNLKSINDMMINRGRNMFRNYFGIDYKQASISGLQQSPPRPYFIGATPTNAVASLPNLPELNLNLSTPHNYVLNLRQGMTDISYFAEDYATPGDTQTKVLYRAKIKAIDATPGSFAPTDQATYDLYNNIPLAVAKVTPKNKCIAFGFPISFMHEAEIIQLFQSILND